GADRARLALPLVEQVGGDEPAEEEALRAQEGPHRHLLVGEPGGGGRVLGEQLVVAALGGDDVVVGDRHDWLPTGSRSSDGLSSGPRAAWSPLGSSGGSGAVAGSSPQE